MYHADLIGGIVSRLAGVKNIVWGVHHTTLVKGESKRSTILVAKLNAYLSIIIPRKVIYCAQKSREVQESIGCNSAKGVVVSNGYNVNDFIPNLNFRKKFREELGLSDDIFLIGHVGRYDPQKDQKNLIEAISFVAEKIKHFKVVMVGTNLDSNNQTLNAHIQNKGLEKHLVLIGRRNDVPAVMNGLDLFVLSSAFGEAFPNVLNEAMACGTPCVTTDVGDAALIVDGTGWVVPPRTPKTLSDAMIQAIEEKRTHHSTWLRRKEDCRKRIVENFSIEKMVSSYQQVWNS
jgi:glycosyltransferase involved in cell wall biosynthesis